jgi:hypothetical protein
MNIAGMLPCLYLVNSQFKDIIMSKPTLLHLLVNHSNDALKLIVKLIENGEK